jgi:hypothetical protein
MMPYPRWSGSLQGRGLIYFGGESCNAAAWEGTGMREQHSLLPNAPIKSVDRRTIAFCRLVRPTIHLRAYLSHQHYRCGGGVARLSHAMIVTHGRAHKLVARWAVLSCHRHTHNCGVVFFDTPLHVIAVLHQNGAPPIR